MGILSYFALLKVDLQGQEINEEIEFNRYNTWVFGESSRIDFSSGEAISSRISKELILPNGCSTISDGFGDLLLFTGGDSLYNSDYHNIINQDLLLGNTFSTQSSLIIPMPSNGNRYYVFAVDIYLSPIYNDGITYSIIDYSNGGLPEVISLNNELLKENSQKIAAVKHQNGKDYWIVVHGFGNEKGGNFYSYLLTENGLDLDAVVTTIGHPHTDINAYNNGSGQMKISPDGSKLALVIPEDGIVEVYDFNTESGKPSMLITSELYQFKWALGLEFSPHSTKLYISISPISEGYCNIYKFNLEDPNLFDSPFLLEHFAYNQNGLADSLLGAMQLGVDGRIYIAKFKKGIIAKDNIGVIYNPDRENEFCNYNKLNNTNNNGLFLNGGGSLVGLPNCISSFLNIPNIIAKDRIVMDTTSFFIRNTANIDSVNWYFVGNGEINSSKLFSPKVLFENTGIVNVSLSTYFNGVEYQFIENVEIVSTDGIIETDFSGSINLYPNPSSGIVNIDINDFSGCISIAIYSIYGSLVFQQDDIFIEGSGFNKQIDLNFCKSGLYMLMVESENFTAYSKIIISSGK